MLAYTEHLSSMANLEMRIVSNGALCTVVGGLGLSIYVTDMTGLQPRGYSSAEKSFEKFSPLTLLFQQLSCAQLGGELVGDPSFSHRIRLTDFVSGPKMV